MHTNTHTRARMRSVYGVVFTRRPVLKSWTRQSSFHIVLIPLGKVCIQIFSLQLWVNSRVD